MDTIQINPKGHYVYFLADEENRVYYIGMSSNVLNRVGTHFTWPNAKEHITRIHLEEFPTRKEAQQAEKKYIYKYQPPWNRMVYEPTKRNGL